MPLDRRFAAEGARIAGVLGDFHLLHLFAEGGAVSVGLGVLVWDGLAREREREREGVCNDLVPYLPVTPTSSDVC